MWFWFRGPTLLLYAFDKAQGNLLKQIPKLPRLIEMTSDLNLKAAILGMEYYEERALE